MLCPIVHRPNLGGMDVLTQVLDRIRLSGTLLFHFELGHPWHLELPARSYALFHYLSQGSATLALGQGQDIQMTEGDFVVITRGAPCVLFGSPGQAFADHGYRSIVAASWDRSSRWSRKAALD